MVGSVLFFRITDEQMEFMLNTCIEKLHANLTKIKPKRIIKLL